MGYMKTIQMLEPHCYIVVFCSVNVDVYEILLGMGYPKGASAEALRQANNDLNFALEVKLKLF